MLPRRKTVVVGCATSLLLATAAWGSDSLQLSPKARERILQYKQTAVSHKAQARELRAQATQAGTPAEDAERLLRGSRWHDWKAREALDTAGRLLHRRPTRRDSAHLRDNDPQISQMLTGRWAVRSAGSAGHFGSTEAEYNVTALQIPGTRRQLYVHAGGKPNKVMEVKVVKEGFATAEEARDAPRSEVQRIKIAKGRFFTMPKGVGVHARMYRSLMDNYRYEDFSDEGGLYRQSRAEYNANMKMLENPEGGRLFRMHSAPGVVKMTVEAKAADGSSRYHPIEFVVR